MIRFDLITLFPDYFDLSVKQSLLGKASNNKLLDINIVDLRNYATDKHRTVDDTPCGGGGGMVLKLEPLDRCLKELGYEHTGAGSKQQAPGTIVLTSAFGKPFIQQTAIEYSLRERLTIICGHYLGVDERILQLYDIDEVSIGDYVLTGGEPAAAVILDAVARLRPKVLGNFESALEDSHMDQLTGSPCYTRPVEYDGIQVPEILLSGDHAMIKQFRRREAIRKCLRNRPDLLEGIEFVAEELELIENERKCGNDHERK